MRPRLLIPEGHTQDSRRGEVDLHGLQVGDTHRPRAAKVLHDSPVGGLSGTVRFEWAAMDAWLEEDERVFVHPRNPYVRVDALRSTRTVRVELDGTVLAESSSPIMVFETGLPTRYYLNRTEINFEHLIPTGTVTECPYKGTTSGYWSVQVGGSVHPDLAWSYDFPTRQLLPIVGLVAFYNEKWTSSSMASCSSARRPTSSHPLTEPSPARAERFCPSRQVPVYEPGQGDADLEADAAAQEDAASAADGRSQLRKALGAPC